MLKYGLAIAAFGVVGLAGLIASDVELLVFGLGVAGLLVIDYLELESGSPPWASRVRSVVGLSFSIALLSLLTTQYLPLLPGIVAAAALGSIGYLAFAAVIRTGARGRD
jgi:hypothetical protein